MQLEAKQLLAAAEHPAVKELLSEIRGGRGYNQLDNGSMFEGEDFHPGKSVFIPGENVWSTGAGAYGILLGTWTDLVERYGFEDFSPKTQDLAAVAILADLDALTDVLVGRRKSALDKLWRVWPEISCESP